MTIYLIITAIALILSVIYYYLQYEKRRVFDDNVDLDLYLDFSENNNSGTLMFRINEIKNEYRAFSVDHVKLHSSKLQLRSQTTINTKLPLPNDGIVLSIAVKKSSGASIKELEKSQVTISGFLYENKNKKRSFKKKLSMVKKSAAKIIPA